MKIALGQTRPVKGDVEANVERHRAFVERSAAEGADLIVFPELSLTGYEPALAKGLALEADDARLESFQEISDRQEMAVGVGAPTRRGEGVCISLTLFQSGRPRRIHSKHFLHADEVPFFVPGDLSPSLTLCGKRIALAICYEISVPEHADRAKAEGASVYLASVAKHANGVAEAEARLPEVARKLSAPALMVNSVGAQDDFVAAGGTGVWNERGERIAVLNASDEGLLIFDTETGEAMAIGIEAGGAVPEG